MTKRIAWLITTGLVASALAVPGIAMAHTSEAIAETGGMHMELALLGADLTVAVGLDVFGNLDTIDVLGPSAPEPDGDELAAGAVEVTDPHRVRFEVDEDGTRVAVMAKKHKLTSTVKAGTFEDLVGIHTWSAVLFPEADEAGTETAPTTVTFTVGGTEDAPTLEIVEVGEDGLPADATFESVGHGDDEEDAALSIIFTWNGYTKILKIKVDVEDEDEDDEPTATLRIELRAKDRQRLRAGLEELAGDHLWTGLLCDGTLARVEYSIGAEGDVSLGGVSFVAPDGDPDWQEPGYEAKLMERGFQIRLDHNQAALKVRFGETEDGVWDLKVDAKTTERCKDHDGDRSGERGKKDRRKSDRDHHEEDHDEEDDD